jgi:hypothetical protein
MTTPFEAPRLKCERARHHLQELRAEIEGFFRRGGAFVAFEIAEEFGVIHGSRTGAFIFREKEKIPLGWPAIIGDVIHNLRSALDLIACDVHRITGGKVKDISGVYYPFCGGKADLPDMIKKRRLNHIGPGFRAIIEHTAPYKKGNDGLRAIHDLDILDKHQLLIPTIAVVAMDWPVKITSGPQQFVTGVMSNGQRLMMFPETFCPLPLGSKIKADFSIVFGDVPVFRGSDVVRQLHACLESVEVILDHFRVEAEKKSLLGILSP